MASVAHGFLYDVFLSFRGEDTRHGFTGNLKKALDDHGVRTFMDDDELRKGDEITPSLLKAIEDSKIAIVVLSKNYASSSFCLEELSKILDSIKDKVNRSVLPVFYKVDPSDIRKLQKSYGEAIAKHMANSNPNIDKWKMSLQQVANLSGFHYKKGEMYEHEFIGKIVEEVSKKITVGITLHVGDYLVGLEPRKQSVISLLNVGSDDTVHMVGIHGIGGIGKTTLALAVYNSIVHQFQCSCFLKVRENYHKNGLELQKILLSQIVEKINDINSVEEGIPILKKMLKIKKVLLLLDDVDNEKQLQDIAGNSNWFGKGSRVIITTRNQRLLTLHGVEAKHTYEMKELNNEDAFELVKWKAFKNEKTDKDFSDYVDVLERAVEYASGLPLALEVIGSHFSNRTIEECKCALDQCERVPDEKIQMTLQLSFDVLKKEEKNVFLDIACCLKGYELTRVEQILHAHHGFSIKNHINGLVEKSLIKISEFNKVTLHDLIEDMGKDIVKQESPNPGERSRLWAYEDIKEVFKENKGTSKIEIICWDPPSKSKHMMVTIRTEWDGEAFKKMENLKTLLINTQNYINQKHLPTSLRVLDRRSVWTCRHYMMEGFLNKKFKNMRVLNFDDDRDLSQIPDLSRSLPKLEVLSIQRCHSLYTIDKSVGFLRNLKVLRIRSCNEIKSVPPLLYCYSLVELDLSYCSELVTIDESVVDLGNLKILRLTGCKRINSVPPLYCPSLVELYLSDCFELESFSVGDGFGDKLKIMSVTSCSNLRSIPPLKLSSLKELDLSYCYRLDNFPLMEDGFLEKIEILRAQSCHNLKSIPRLNLNSLKELNLSRCYSLESFPSVVDDGALLENIRSFNIEECILLKSIPPLRVTWLKKFNISHCLSLESFPEILGDMGNMPELHLDNIPKKLLPLPLQNLTPPHTLYPCYCEIVDFPNRVAEVSMLLAESTIEVEGHVSPTESSLVEYICLCYSNLSDEYWSKSFMLFAKVKELHLINNEFTVLPKSMENCKFLWRLVLDDCVKLQEIKGIPPCLKVFSALNCQLLTSSSKSKLLNKKLHEAGNTWFRLPGAKIPEWFYQPRLDELPISFWFRNKFPAIILCVYSPFLFSIYHKHRAKVIINGNTFSITHGLALRRESKPDKNHLHLFHLQLANFNDEMDNTLLENKWNHAEVNFGILFSFSGIHVLNGKSRMEDVQFTNPEIE